MRRAWFFLTIALIATVVSSAARAQNQARQANQRPLVIRGGLLIDGSGAAPVPNSIITIVNGRIQSIGREGSVTIPADAAVIDATGKTLIPGLVDSHVHLFDPKRVPYHKSATYQPPDPKYLYPIRHGWLYYWSRWHQDHRDPSSLRFQDFYRKGAA